jgi:DNA-binding MarR family transcriptional regulator
MDLSVLIELWNRVLAKMIRVEKMPKEFGTQELLYPQEIHIIQLVGDNPEIGMTEIIQRLGVTKGSVSQIVKKLTQKAYIVKFKDQHNHKEVKLRLRNKGEIAYEKHKEHHTQFYEKLIAFVEHMPEKEVQIYYYSFRDDGARIRQKLNK